MANKQLAVHVQVNFVSVSSDEDAEMLRAGLLLRQVLGRELPRLAAYTLGLLGMMLPLSMWLMDHEEYEILQMLWFVIAAAGMTVFALYGFDEYCRRGRGERQSKEREQLASDQMEQKKNGSTN